MPVTPQAFWVKTKDGQTKQIFLEECSRSANSEATQALRPKTHKTKEQLEKENEPLRPSTLEARRQVEELRKTAQEQARTRNERALKAAKDMEKERLFAHYPVAGNKWRSTTATHFTPDEAYNIKRYKVRMIKPKERAELEGNEDLVVPPFSLDPTVKAAALKREDPVCCPKEPVDPEKWKNDNMTDLPQWNKGRQAESVSNRRPPPEPDRSALMNMLRRRDNDVPTPEGGMFTKLKPKNDGVDIAIVDKNREVVCTTEQPKLVRKFNTGKKKNRFARPKTAAPQTETTKPAPVDNKRPITASTAIASPLPDAETGTAEADDGQAANSAETHKKPAARPKSVPAWCTEPRRDIESEYNEAQRTYGWRMEVHGDPFCLKHTIQDQRRPYSINVKEPHITKNQFKHDIHFNSENTFFYSTVANRPPRYEIDPTFVSDRYGPMMREKAKRAPRSTTKDRFLQLSFIY